MGKGQDEYDPTNEQQAGAYFSPATIGQESQGMEPVGFPDPNGEFQVDWDRVWRERAAALSERTGPTRDDWRNEWNQQTLGEPYGGLRDAIGSAYSAYSAQLPEGTHPHQFGGFTAPAGPVTGYSYTGYFDPQARIGYVDPRPALGNGMLSTGLRRSADEIANTAAHEAAHAVDITHSPRHAALTEAAYAGAPQASDEVFNSVRDLAAGGYLNRARDPYAGYYGAIPTMRPDASQRVGRGQDFTAGWESQGNEPAGYSQEQIDEAARRFEEEQRAAAQAVPAPAPPVEPEWTPDQHEPEAASLTQQYQQEPTQPVRPSPEEDQLGGVSPQSLYPGRPTARTMPIELEPQRKEQERQYVENIVDPTAGLERAGVPGHKDFGTQIHLTDVPTTGFGFPTSLVAPVLQQGAKALGLDPTIDIGPREVAGAAIGMAIPTPGRMVGPAKALLVTRLAKPIDDMGGPALKQWLDMRRRPSSELPERALTAWQETQRNWTDDRMVAVALNDIAEVEAKRLGNPIEGEWIAQQRMDSSLAVDVNAKEHLRPAIVGLNPNLNDPHSLYHALEATITQRANIEAARMLGARTERDILATVKDIDLPVTIKADLKRATSSESSYQHHLNVATQNGDTALIAHYSDQLVEAQTRLKMATDAAEAYKIQKAKQITASASVKAANVASTRSFPGGINVADSEQILADLKQNLTPEQWAEIERRAALAYQARDKLIRDPIVQSGMWTQDQYDLFTQQYPEWMPTEIMKHLPAAGSTGGAAGARTSSVPSQLVKALTPEGTESKSMDSFQAIMRRAFTVARKANDNDAFNSFFKDVYPNLPAGPGQAGEQIHQAIQYTPAELGIMRKADPAAAKAASAAMKKVTDLLKNEEEYKLFEGFVGGQNVHYAVEKPYWEIVKLENAPFMPKGLVAAPMKAIHFGVVSRNPLWTGYALTVDMIEAGLRSSIRQSAPGASLDKIPLFGQIPALARYYKSVAEVMPDMFHGLLTGEFKGEWANYLKGEGYAGGGMFGKVKTSPQEAEKYIAELTKDNLLVIRNKAELLGLIGKLVTSPSKKNFQAVRENELTQFASKAATFKPVEHLNERADLWPRVAEYNLAKKQGASELQAVLRGRTLTLDFNQGGRASKALSAWIPFFNPTMQGSRAFAQMARENPAGFISTVGGYMAAVELMADAWNRSDPERMAAYESRPQYQKDAAVIFEVGGKTPGFGPLNVPQMQLPVGPTTDKQGGKQWQGIALPMRQFKPFHIAMRAGLDGLDSREHTNLAMALVSSLSPIQGSNPENAMLGIFPQTGLEPIEQILNKDMFTNQTMDTPETQERAGAVGRAIEGKTGIPASRAEHAIRTFGGGFAGAYMGAANLIAGPETTAPDPGRPQSWPIVGGQIGRFVKGTNAVTSQADVRERQTPFYTRGEDPQRATEQFGQWIRESFEPGKAVNLGKLQAGELTHQQYGDADQNLNEARRTERDAIYQRLAPTELDPAKRKALIDQLYKMPGRLSRFGESTDLPAGANVAEASAAYSAAQSVGTTRADHDAAQQNKLIEYADKWHVDPNAVRDAITAFRSQTVLPTIKNVSEAQLQDAFSRYLAPRKDDGSAPYLKPTLDPMTGQPIIDPKTNQPKMTPDQQLLGEMRRAEVAKMATEMGLPANDLMTRLQVRFQGPNDDPIDISKNKAEVLRNTVSDIAKFPKYVDPQSGQPLATTYEEEAKIDNALLGWTGQSRVPPIIRQAREAAAAGEAAKLQWLYEQPGYKDYQEWFGPGKVMSKPAWDGMQSGQYQRYRDTAAPDQADFRDQVIKLASLLPRTSPLKRQLMPMAVRFKALQSMDWRRTMDADEYLRQSEDYALLDQMLQGRQP